MELNEYQKIVVSIASGSQSTSEGYESQTQEAAIGLRDTALQIFELTNNRPASGKLNETAFFNLLCDALHYTTLATNALGTNLEAIAQIALDRARRRAIGKAQSDDEQAELNIPSITEQVQ